MPLSNPHASFLSPSHELDCDHPTLKHLAHTLKSTSQSELDLVTRTFEFVRDEIRHSVDYRIDTRTCHASEVLAQRAGFCYAKSHLLAALLRANGVPAGLCYQRVALDKTGQRFGLHGLNAVYLRDFGWLRLDARGNKPGVNARCAPPQEHLAFALNVPGEQDLPGIFAEPLPEIVTLLTEHTGFQAVIDHIPDISADTLAARADLLLPR